MKRAINLLLVFVFIVPLLHSDEAYARRRETILDFFNSKYMIRTYVSDIINLSGKLRIDKRELKKGIEKALASRLSHTFEIVWEKTEADIIINTMIVEYIWTEEDPIDMIITIPVIIFDAVKKENYARMQAVFTIVDAKNDVQLWRKQLQSTITSATMTEEESYDLSNKRIVKVFIRKLFKKPKQR